MGVIERIFLFLFVQLEEKQAVRGNEPYEDKREQNPDLLCRFLQVASKVF